MPTDAESRRAELYNLLGRLPDRSIPIQAHTIITEEHPDYILETLLLDCNGCEPVPAYFTIPQTAHGKVPAILYNHAHGGAYGLGKDELINGRNALQKPPYARALARAGYAALCIDHWAFGQRRGRTEQEIFKHMLWHGQVMWGMMVFDSLRALDYLSDRPEIDPRRIGTLGLSMGSTMAWWLAALDIRVKACIDICCLTDFHALIETAGLDEHRVYYYVPNLLNHFTTAQINALISPRPHLSLAGRYDRLTPLAGLEKINRELTAVYQNDGSPDAWQLLIYDTGHFETAHMRSQIMTFLQEWL